MSFRRTWYYIVGITTRTRENRRRKTRRDAHSFYADAHTRVARVARRTRASACDEIVAFTRVCAQGTGQRKGKEESEKSEKERSRKMRGDERRRERVREEGGEVDPLIRRLAAAAGIPCTT